MASSHEIDEIIKVGSRAAAGVGVIGAATTDLPALVAIWGTMIYKIAKENYDLLFKPCNFEKEYV